MRTQRLFCSLALLVAVSFASGTAVAATISAQARPNFARVSFDFGHPVRMQLAQSGTKLTVRFDQPIAAKADSIPAKLKANVTAASISPDGKSIILTLAKPYRVRQFISGNSVGIDLLTDKVADAPATAPKEKPAAEKPQPIKAAAKEELLTTKPAEKPVVKAEPAPKKPAAKAEPAPKPTAENPILSTKPAPVEKPAAAAPAPKAEAPAPAPAPTVEKSDTLLTTKSETPVDVTDSVGDMMSTKADIVPPANGPPPGDALGAAPKKEAPAEPAPVAEAEPAKAPAAPEVIEPEAAAAENAPAEKATASTPFTVTAKTTKEGTTITFPWKERTAAAVFERAGDIWITFSNEVDVKPALLTSALPKQVVRAEQFKLPGATVLRLSTDGSVHATTKQQKGKYGWEVTLSTAVPAPSLEIPVTDVEEGKKRSLLLKTFDTSDPLYFYDPTQGDRVIVVPSYENGRGVSATKQFPELTILPTQQGIAAVTQRDDIITQKNRNGVTLEGNYPLSISSNMPIISPGSKPVPGAAATANVLLPYDQWYAAPEDFYKKHAELLNNLSTANESQLPDSLLALAQLYLGQGMGAEALGYLNLLQEQHPDFYTERKLGVMTAAANLLLNRVIPDAAMALAGTNLDDSPEAQMWRQLVLLAVPTATGDVEKLEKEAEAERAAAAQKAAAENAVEQGTELPPEAAPQAPKPPATFKFLKYNAPYIRYYPPRVRQRMAVIAADAYIADGQPAEAVKIFDTLNRDGILGPVQTYAEFALASTAASKPETDVEALKALDKLGAQTDDPYIQARARYAAVLLRLEKEQLTADQAADALESIRLSWRGDALQRQILVKLAEIYQENKRYDDTLRTWRYLLDTFPTDPDTLTISGDMSDLFQELFLNGMADSMTPLKSLALFYEFRELTPIGATGDTIIQKLADRLAAVDLLDRATQLLEHQIKFRVSGEDRARVGARLGLLYLLNHQPAEALSVLEVTNYGEAPLELRRQRIQLTAQALSDTGKHEEALSMLFNDDSRETDLLKLDILWAMKDWPNVINQAEDILADRPNLTATLTAGETQVLLKLALGYSFEADRTQLRYLHDYYSGLLGDGQYKDIFDFLTNDTSPLDADDFRLVAQQISRTESFLDKFRKEIAAGNLSNTVK